MKKFFSATFLLFLLFFCLVSCDKFSFLKARGFSQKDYYLKNIQTLVALDKIDEAKDDVLKYLLVTDENDDRELAVRLFIDYECSDVQNVLLLKSSDGFMAQTVLFKSLYNLGQNGKAKIILSDYMADSLTIEQYLKILIKYPIDEEYTLSFFKSWFHILTDDEMFSFTELFSSYYLSIKSEDCRNNCKTFIDEIKASDYSYLVNNI